MNMKAAASLTGSLLARKGAAYPASYSAPTPSPDDPEGASKASADRAYNDPRVIASAPPAPAAPVQAPGSEQLSEHIQDDQPAPSSPAANQAPAPAAKKPLDYTQAPASEPASAIQPVPGSSVSGGVSLPQTMDKMGRVRLSVRLDPDRYLRVKMASARTRWSAQDIVIAALDRYLKGKPDTDSGGDDESGGQGNLN